MIPIPRALALSLLLLMPGLAEARHCRPKSGAVAADTSAITTAPFLARMKEIGVSTIIRYYDHEDETLPGKTLRAPERDLIAGSGFRLLVVFQHRNDRLPTFTPERGAADAARALDLARENAQPGGSAVYFGVDGPWGERERPLVRAYFREAAPAIRAAGYRIGIYGGGYMCRAMAEEGLADLCWLANARSWPGYAERLADRRSWRLRQALPETCGGRAVDFNFPSSPGADFGQFR
ncbi:glycoside hydrolase domain-containing protein [Enterovirga sp.]|uniref:glycoside hydrolase domain-containing protein n=1 Tax=Enterovirga sp. TaxID=2026350 RepID=UPI002C518E50|nr:glycoside hydrolase domain-containing protein [Enterovirga sp.]HMO30092.1 DUF1906 domain-containing protein [Enterovirga sp.]